MSVFFLRVLKNKWVFFLRVLNNSDAVCFKIGAYPRITYLRSCRRLRNYTQITYIVQTFSTRFGTDRGGIGTTYRYKMFQNIVNSFHTLQGFHGHCKWAYVVLYVLYTSRIMCRPMLASTADETRSPLELRRDKRSSGTHDASPRKSNLVDIHAVIVPARLPHIILQVWNNNFTVYVSFLPTIRNLKS